ncbi:hypothetical protein N7470_002011 [Penicillium chermesinum]|nr:hypothetical protein N7470_002011 [Penicillium chermesinum]
MVPPTPISISRFAETQLQLLLEEHEAEPSSKSQDDSSARGSDGQPRLGQHGIRVGDVVRANDVSAATAKKMGKDKSKDGAKDASKGGPEGVVTRVSDQAICVAFGQQGSGAKSKEDDESVEELWGKKIWLIKLANDVTYRRMKQTMEKMAKLGEGEHSHFMRLAFGHTTPLQANYEATGPIEFTDPTLNDSQKDAIRFALGSQDIALIHGPPGTGKTHTLIELILQFVQRKKRILVCGPSNVSVDNIVERLAPKKVPVVRIGHPARLLPSVLEHSLEVLTQTSEAAGIVKDVRKEMDEKQASIRKTKTGRERRAIYEDLKHLRKEFRERESKCVDNLVRESSVVLATLHGAGGHQLKNQQFDVVIIDEASQALEAQSNLKSKDGNGKDSQPEKKDTPQKEILKGVSLERTLFDRLLALHGPGIKRMLTTQYRMHEKIMRFPSDELYESKLIAADSVKSRLLAGLPYEVQGGDFPEKVEDKEIGQKEALLGESKSNEMEALVVARHVDNLVAAGVRPDSIAVITPYNGQLALLSQMLRERYPGLELGSVDGFQGREKEAVVVSLVRSNEEHEVGFLGEKRRLNVAMTRPSGISVSAGIQRPSAGKGSTFLKHWMDFLEEHADLRYPDAGDLL